MFIHAKEKLENLGINTDINIEKFKEKILKQKEEISLLGSEFKNIDKRLENLRKDNSKIKYVLDIKSELNRDKEQEI